MAKTRTPKTKTPIPPKVPPIDPCRVHQLLGMPGPYEPPPAPPDRPFALTFWDCGMSVNELRRRKPELFDKNDWHGSEPFARHSATWCWRQVTLTAVEPGGTYQEQMQSLPPDVDLPQARELAVYLVVLALSTGERPEVRRMRCRDTVSSGRRVFVGHFGQNGLEIGNVSDFWKSPGLALASVYTPPPPAKK